MYIADHREKMQETVERKILLSLPSAFPSESKQPFHREDGIVMIFPEQSGEILLPESDPLSLQWISCEP